MSLPRTDKNGITSDSPTRNAHPDEHNEGLNCSGKPWRGGHSRERGRGRGRGSNGHDGGDWQLAFRGDGEESRERGRPGTAGGQRGGRGGYRGHYQQHGSSDGGRGFRQYGGGWHNNNNSDANEPDGSGEQRMFSRRDDDRGRGGKKQGRYVRGGRGGRFLDDNFSFRDQGQDVTEETQAAVPPPKSDEQQQQPAQQQGRFDFEPYERTRGRGRDRKQRGRGGYFREAEDERQQEPQEQQQQQQYVSRDPISTNPNRTQRAPHLRKNCHDEREIEALFEHHHQQRGITLDNYANIPVEIVPQNVEPVQSFEDLFVEPALSLNIVKCGYKQPTPVQRYGIPVCLNGDDLMACAQTGSGKTAAFLVPVVHYILKHGVSPSRGRASHPLAVIMAPTRELALQIYDEVRKLTFRTDIFHDVVYGGTPYPTRFENDILVACPGRLKDIFDRGIVSFSQVKFLVLDEADRMLEMGFEEQIEYLVASRYTDMPQTSQRQTLMFSATFPQRILNLAKRYLRQQYYLLTVGRVGSTTKNITQKMERVQESEKMDKLFEIIYQQKQTDLVLIFVETKRSAEDLHYALKSEGIPSATIHGDRRQFDRERALRDFKEGITPILVATDVASRGLDIPNVAHVIQYDLPKEMDDYTHRIGRTGRAGNKGIATSFYNKNNRNLAVDLYNYLKEHEQNVPMWLEEEKDIVEGDRFLGMSRGRGGGRSGGGGGGNYAAAPTLSNSTWGDSTSLRGRARGGSRQTKTSSVDDGGF